MAEESGLELVDRTVNRALIMGGDTAENRRLLQEDVSSLKQAFAQIPKPADENLIAAAYSETDDLGSFITKLKESNIRIVKFVNA